MKCPCCTRAFEAGSLDETKKLVKAFQDTVNELGDKENSPLLQMSKEIVNSARAAKKNYQTWRNSINENMSDLMEHNRITAELGGLEATVNELEASVASHQAQLDALNDERIETQNEANDLRSLVELSKRWMDDAGRVSSKKLRISQKNADLSLSVTSATNTNNRNLRTVERDIELKMEEKDTLMSKVMRLNKEMTGINTNISNISTQVSALLRRILGFLAKPHRDCC
jgi:chromosome segregation ATPase